MPTLTCPKSSTPLNTLSSAVPNSTMPVQSGPYTKAQFQSTMEGSRTIKSVKEIEQILRDYPAALELYRTGKYKVKVKYEANVERVILVEKRVTKPESNTTVSNENQENQQTKLSNPSKQIEHEKNVEKEPTRQVSRSRSRSQDPVETSSPPPALPPKPTIAPPAALINGNNIVHATIPSIRLASNAQPKVDHQRIPSSEREALTASPRKLPGRNRSASRENHFKVQNVNQQGDKIAREYPKTIVPFIPQTVPTGPTCQPPRFPQPYFSNPMLQQQQQQQQQQQHHQQQQRNSIYVSAPLTPQPNPLFRQQSFYNPRPTTPIIYQQPPNIFPMQTASNMLKPTLRSANNFPPASRSVTNMIGVPPSIRTFHGNQQPITSFRSFYQSQGPLPMNNRWTNVNNLPVGTLPHNNNAYVEQPRGARNRARSVDVGPRNYPIVAPTNIQKPNVPAYVEQFHYHHHHHHRHRPQPVNTNVGPTAELAKEQPVLPKERTTTVTYEKLTVRQLNETFCRIDQGGRLAYAVIPGLLQHYGITITDNDLVLAAKELEFNISDPISARRLIRILVKMGKITKSTQQQQQQQQQPKKQSTSPLMLPEDREVTDIMTQHHMKNNQMYASLQTNQ